jgi:hypothetical protein
MAHDVFICHSSRDKTVVDAVCSVLEARGVRCWVAPRDIAAGVSWGEAIINAIAGAKAMVLVFSSTANKSQQVEREIERAVHHNIPVIPFRIENVAPERALEYFLSTPHWLDAYTPPLDGHLQQLADQVVALVGKSASDAPPLAPIAAAEAAAASIAPVTPTPAAAAYAPPSRGGSNLVPLIAGGVVAVAILVLAAVIFFAKPFGGGPAAPAANATTVAASTPANATAPPANGIAAAAPPPAAPAPTAAPTAPTSATAAPSETTAAPTPAPAPPAHAAVTAGNRPGLCLTADPTSTPLNIRSEPKGPITGNIPNGVRIRVTGHFQENGRTWVQIVRADSGAPVGWVFARFLDCPNGLGPTGGYESTAPGAGAMPPGPRRRGGLAGY